MADGEAADTGKDAGAATGVPRRGLKGNLFAFAHLAVLSVFALAQPLFSLLSDNPEFFAARGATSGEIIVFALLLVFVPPLVLLLVEILVGLVSERARTVLHLVLIALLAAVIFIQALKKSIDASDAVLIVVSLGLGALGALLYARAEPVRSFLSVLSPVPIVVLVIFLFISPVHKLTLSSDASAKDVKGGSRAPIVFLGFDEFPGIDLMTDKDGQLDKKRYPGFAELASKGTWFPNAHSIYDSTTSAWPAIMDGDYPSKDKLPTSSDHPNSIFAILGKSHVMNVSEEATSVCPSSLCKDVRLDEPFASRLKSMSEDLEQVYKHVVAPPGMEADLPSVSDTWGDFGGGGGGGGGSGGGSGGGGEGPNTKKNLQGSRNKRLDAWIQSIHNTKRPALNFKHVLLPHVPWQYLPDGRQYRRVATEPIPGISRESYKDAGQTVVLQQRHLLQVGFADHEVQELIAHLKKEGLWDKAMVVVTADHGVSFRQGQFDRRKVNDRNIDEISPIPLFIKAPGQAKPKVNRGVVETTDVLPTILDELHIDAGVKMDGRSAFSPQVRDRTQVKMLTRDYKRWIRVPEARFAQLRQAAIDRRVQRFGNTGAFDDRFFRVGSNQQLLGRPARSGGTSQSRASLTEPGQWADVDPQGHHGADLDHRQGQRRRGTAQGHRRGGQRHDPWRGQHLPPGHRRGRDLRPARARDVVPQGPKRRAGVRGPGRDPPAADGRHRHLGAGRSSAATGPGGSPRAGPARRRCPGSRTAAPRLSARPPARCRRTACPPPRRRRRRSRSWGRACRPPGSTCRRPAWRGSPSCS